MGAAVISARLIPWKPGMVPGIAYELDDGSQACVAGPLAWTIPGLMQRLILQINVSSKNR